MPERTEGEEDEDEDECQRRWDNDRESGPGLLQVLELPAELDDVVFGKFHLLLLCALRLVHEAFNVSRFQVHHQRGTPQSVIMLNWLERS